jgi:hypothetical protein
MREVFVGLQNTIEAIDRAIAHERLIATDHVRDSRFVKTDFDNADTFTRLSSLICLNDSMIAHKMCREHWGERISAGRNRA